MRSSLSTDLWCLLWSSLGSWSLLSGSLWDSLLLLLLGLHFLEVSVLDILLGSFDGLISGGGILVTLSLDILETHTNNGFLDSSGLSGSLLLDVLSLYFLVLSSPGLGPGKLNGLNFLVVKRSGFGGNEVVDLSILTNELGASTGPDTHLRVDAGISLNNHLSESK